MKEYILSIDQGTSSSRAIIFDKEGNIISSSQKNINMLYNDVDFVEQDANEIFDSVEYTINEAIKKIKLDISSIKSIGITNQRETTILWDKRTGIPVYNAIVWQSKQSKQICDKLIKNGYSKLFKDKTGLLIDPYFSATKVKWILDNIDGVKKMMDDGNLLFGTVDTWLLYKLTSGKVHKTDYTNASRTLFFNIFEKKWDNELLDILGINKNILPQVCDSNSKFGYTDKSSVFKNKVLISAILGDQQASLFGHLCLDKGSIKNTYGTGCFMLMNTGLEPAISNNGLLTTIAYSIDGVITYALEGSVFVAGSAIQWLRDSLNFFENAKDSEIIANSVEDNYGVYVVPAFVGLGTPYWDKSAKGAIFGLTRGTTKAHITRATLESLAYQTKDIIEVMEKESNISPIFLKVDGGGSENNFLMQFQSDLLNINIKKPFSSESTALGVALMSGLASGMYNKLDDILSIDRSEKIFQPKMSDEKRDNLYSKWKKAVAATRLFK